MNAIWAWFLTSRIGRALLAIGAMLFALALAAAAGFARGKYAEAKANATQRIKDATDAAKAAGQTYADAEAAAEQVKQEATQQLPPDPGKRNDLDNTF